MSARAAEKIEAEEAYKRLRRTAETAEIRRAGRWWPKFAQRRALPPRAGLTARCGMGVLPERASGLQSRAYLVG